MPVVLIVEILSALVAVAALFALIVHLVKTLGSLRRSSLKVAWHVKASLVMCVAAFVHGVCAMVYASGANILAYEFGWLALAAFVLSGMSMVKPVKDRLSSPLAWHIGLFVAGVALVVAHAIAGRM